MADRVKVDVSIRRAVLAEIRRGHGTYELVRGAAERVATEMRRGAPVRTGAGRASIEGRAELGPDGWYGVASWDEPHYYMGILNSRREFAEPALQRVRYV